MFKNPIAIIILFSMALHCSCKLGFVDQLYQNRNEIAYTVGLIAEIPIAMCNSDYDFNQGLNIETHDSDSVPQPLFQVREINLFFVSELQLQSSRQADFDGGPITSPLNLYSSTWAPNIFHPPSV